MQLVACLLSGYNFVRTEKGVLLMTGKLVIVSGVSGSGKTTIVQHAIARGIGARVITCTTRAPRENNGIREVNGVDYHFLSEDEFMSLVQAGEFAEYENNYGRLYGTRKKDIGSALVSHNIAFAIVDTRGAESLMHLYPDARSIFILAKKEDIQKRLELRGEKEDVILRRLREFDLENERSRFFDVVVGNYDNQLNVALTIFNFAILFPGRPRCRIPSKS